MFKGSITLHAQSGLSALESSWAWISSLMLYPIFSLPFLSIHCYTAFLRTFTRNRLKCGPKSPQKTFWILLENIAIATRLRTGCRGGTPGWGRSPYTPLKPSVLSNLATAIPLNCAFGQHLLNLPTRSDISRHQEVFASIDSKYPHGRLATELASPDDAVEQFHYLAQSGDPSCSIWRP